MNGEAWEDMAECVNHPELSWFPTEDIGRGGSNSFAVQGAKDRAKSICISECPVNVDCLAFAFNSSTGAGIWGGVHAGEALWKRLRRLYNRGDDWVAAYLRETRQSGLLERQTG